MFSLAACSNDGDEKGGGTKSDEVGSSVTSGSSASPGSTPKPKPVETDSPSTENPSDNPANTEGGGEHGEGNAEDEAQAEAAAREFASNLVNRTLTTEQWRAVIIPKLYDSEMKELYSQLDPWSIPFCTAVRSVDVNSYGTFSYGIRVYFQDSASVLILEVMDVSSVPGAKDFQIINMNNNMVDSGGC